MSQPSNSYHFLDFLLYLPHPIDRALYINGHDWDLSSMLNLQKDRASNEERYMGLRGFYIQFMSGRKFHVCIESHLVLHWFAAVLDSRGTRYSNQNGLRRTIVAGHQCCGRYPACGASPIFAVD